MANIIEPSILNLNVMHEKKEPFQYQKPPPLDVCIQQYETDLSLSLEKRVPVNRVFVLGAGFSRAFGFTTSATIVKGMMDFFALNMPNVWFEHNYWKVEQWLNMYYPNWHETSPNLIDVANKFFPYDFHKQHATIDPIRAYADKVSWEDENYPFAPPGFHYEDVLLSFEALLCIYLFAGLRMNEVLVDWANKLFQRFMEDDVIVTLNWDVIPEALLTMNGIRFTRYEWRADYVKVIKLHGSIDLIGLPNEKMRNHVRENPDALECLTPLLWRVVTSEGFFPRTHPWPFGRELFPWEWYNKSAILIMPPYYTYGYGYKLIQFNWRKAMTALERAKEVFIIGYSLCESDKQFCSLLEEIAKTWSLKNRVQVWNPDPEVGERAKILCGANRIDFHQKLASEIAL